MKNFSGSMVRRSYIVIAICLFPFCKKTTEAANNPPVSTPPSIDTATYQLAWSDEFDDASINTSVWNFETGGSGWGNHEQEYYQPQNAAIENGNLVITAK